MLSQGTGLKAMEPSCVRFEFTTNTLAAHESWRKDVACIMDYGCVNHVDHCMTEYSMQKKDIHML